MAMPCERDGESKVATIETLAEVLDPLTTGCAGLQHHWYVTATGNRISLCKIATPNTRFLPSVVLNSATVDSTFLEISPEQEVIAHRVRGFSLRWPLGLS